MQISNYIRAACLKAIAHSHVIIYGADISCFFWKYVALCPSAAHTSLLSLTLQYERENEMW